MISTLNKKKYALILTIILLILALPVNAKTNNKNLVNIYFFHSKDCSHCNSEIKFLDSIEEKYENIKIYRYEVHDSKNNEARINVQKLYDIKSNGVPLTIIGDTPYIGYSEELSNINFIKTIEYYSRYGYTDQVGELLQIETLPTYKINESNPTLEHFIETYGNYKLIGSLYTNDLNLSSNALILGILSQFSLIKIIAITILIILLSKIKDTKIEIYLLALYLVTSFILNTTHAISNNIYAVIIKLTILIIFILGLIKWIKAKKIQYLYSSIILIISLISGYLEKHFYTIHGETFKEIITIHNISTLNKISYYGNYFFIMLIINILFILMFSSIKNKYKK